MSRAVSDTLKEAIYRSDTERVFIVLVTIRHPSLAAPLRFTSDAVETLHQGHTHVPFKFEVSLPTDEPDQPPSTVLQIENVDRQIAQTLRELDGAPHFVVTIVLDDDPDRIEAGPFTMKLVNARYGALTAQADIQGPSLIDEPYPVDSYNPIDYPGLPV